MLGIAIAVVGTPHSGKTLLTSTLYNLLRQKNVNFFVQRACPDGEGQWSAEASQTVVQKVRIKGRFDSEFAETQKKSIQRLKEQFDLVLVDLGGLPSSENRELLKLCDYYILLARSDDDPKIQKILKGWTRLLQELHEEGLKPIAQFTSAWNGMAEVYSSDSVFKARLVRLDRSGVPFETFNVISQFVDWLLEKFNLGVVKMSPKGKFSCEIREFEEFVFVDVRIGENGIMSPEELPELVRVVESVGNRYFGKGVVISGRLPIWAHSALAHLFHPAKFVAHFDPRLKGGVIVATHSPEYKLGQVIPVEL